jgi:uncharacterized protein (DUF488 family)
LPVSGPIRAGEASTSLIEPLPKGMAWWRIVTMTRTIYTVGHSSSSVEELIETLDSEQIQLLVDVRRFPSSQRHPQYNRPRLEAALSAKDVDYLWMGESLGGHRKEILPVDQSPNRAWQEAAFRNYADAMGTEPFLEGIEQLEWRAERERTALMCAERDWAHCHRRLLSDLLVVRGWRVIHLPQREDHQLHPSAQVRDGRLCYPGLL